jgi:hypothetical protein
MTGTLELIRHYADALPPLAKFAIVMAIIVGIPPRRYSSGSGSRPLSDSYFAES